MKQGCWTPWLLQDQTIELFYYKHVLFFKESAKWFWRQFRDHQGCPSHHRLRGQGCFFLLSFKGWDHISGFQKASMTLPSASGMGLPLQRAVWAGSSQRAVWAGASESKEEEALAESWSSKDVTLPPQRAWRAKLRTTEDYSQALRST